MCSSLSVELALAWRTEHPEHLSETNDEELLAHIDLPGLPPCYVSELVKKGRLSLLTKTDANREKRQKMSSGLQSFGSWTGRIGDCLDRICAVEFCGPTQLIVTPLRGLPFDSEGKTVHTPQVVRVCDSYLTFAFQRPFLRPSGDRDYTHPDSGRTISGVKRSESFPTGYVLADGADADGGWRPFGIVPPFMGDRNSRFAAAAPSHGPHGPHGPRVYFVKMCGPGADCAVFDIKTCTWAQLPPLLVSRQWPCIALTDEHLYVVGGGQTERLCVTAQQWEFYGPCVPLTHSAAVVVSPFIYVVGGACPETGSISSAVTRITTLDGSCVQMPPMIEARACPGAFADEGPGGARICVIGGTETYHRNGRRLAHAEALDTAEPKWRALEVQRAQVIA
jgi:hypothetical protein